MTKRNIEVTVKFVLIIIFVLLLIALSKVEAASVATENNNDSQQEVKQRSILAYTTKSFPELDYAVYYEPEPTEELLARIRVAIKELGSINNEQYTCEAVMSMQEELARLKKVESRLESDLNKYLTWEEEHYYAAKVWEFFRQRGFNNEVTCAIIGNMMIETSGGTLDLVPDIYSKSGNYYGLCQWSQKYYPGTKDLPFEYQLDYLLGSMPWEFNTFGKNYKSGFKYEDFIAITNVEEAALAFTKAYERCGQASYEMRQEAAVKAYEYFNLNG